MNTNELENKGSDWLSKEKMREASISVWDFDDSAKWLKETHKENCEAHEIKENHEKVHQAEIARERVVRTASSPRSVRKSQPAKGVGAIVVIMCVIIFATIAIMIIDGAGVFVVGEVMFAVVYLFVIFAVIFSAIKRTKK